MGTLHLVRHGQASFGADDYDRLSTTGHRQALRLGEFWRAQGLAFEAVYCGTLRRHEETLAGVVQGLAASQGTAPEVQRRSQLNEYDSQALITAVHPEPLQPADTPERYRAHFRLLCDALAQWMAGVISPVGMPSWDDFSGGVRTVLDEIRHQHAGKQVLLVSSGGPISTAVGEVLGTAPEVTIALNMRIRNSAVTEMSIAPKRLMLQTFNTLPHLNEAPYAGWVTHA